MFVAAELFRDIQPDRYLQHFLEQGIRPDGRELGERRTRSVRAGVVKTAHGSALASCGATTVLCTVSAELCEPDPLRPDRGFLVPTVDLSALCGPHHRPGPPSDAAQALASALHRVLHQSVAPTGLKNALGVWAIYTDFTCLSDDGNCFDACVLALSHALNDTRLPKLKPQAGHEGSPLSPPPSDRLPVKSGISSAAFAVAHNQLLADPTHFESGLADQTIDIQLSGKQLCGISVVGTGHQGSTLQRIKDCIAIAQQRSD